jgi:hypothetical protein
MKAVKQHKLVTYLSEIKSSLNSQRTIKPECAWAACVALDSLSAKRFLPSKCISAEVEKIP